MEKIRILQINKMYYPVIGGIERIVQQIAEGLCSRTDMRVLACRDKGRSIRENINDVEVHRAGSLGIAMSMPLSLSFFHMFRTLSQDRDILHIHMPFPLADIAMCLHGFHGHVAIWWHSDIIRQKKMLLLYKPFMKRLLDRADVIMVATQGHIDGSDYLPPYREKCVVIPFGVDEELLRQSELYANMPNKQDGLPTFLFVGRLVHYKGCDVLLDAFSRVHGATLSIVGSGPLEASLRARAGQPDLAGRVHFYGSISDIALRQAFASCDVFVLPSVSKNEAFGIVQIEAMAYGKPVINTHLPGGVPYVSLDGVTGLTVPPNNAEALSAAMQKLVDDTALRNKYGQSAFLRARNVFAMGNMLDHVFGEYEKLMAKKR